MTTVEEIKNYALLGAVIKNNIDIARKLLIEGADPDYPVHLIKLYKKLIHLALKRRHIEMIKLLVEYSAEVDEYFLESIFQPENHRFTKELVTCAVHYNSDIKFIQKVFDELTVCTDFPESLSMEIFELLMDRGLPIDGIIHLDYQINSDDDDVTPLHLSLIYNKTSFILALIEAGADVIKKTVDGRSPLYLAVEYENDESIIKLLLEKGALVNETNRDGKTALFQACENIKPKILQMLLDSGADANICDVKGDTLLKYAVDPEIKSILAKELAKWPLIGKVISPKINEFLRCSSNNDFRQNCRNCYLELKRMKKYKFYNDFSLYDVYQARNRFKKLTNLTKNKDFVTAFESSWNRELFKNYGLDLGDIFIEAVERRDVFLSEQEKLTSIFKDYLPDLVIRKISYILLFK